MYRGRGRGGVRRLWRPAAGFARDQAMVRKLKGAVDAMERTPPAAP